MDAGRYVDAEGHRAEFAILSKLQTTFEFFVNGLQRIVRL